MRWFIVTYETKETKVTRILSCEVFPSLKQMNDGLPLFIMEVSFEEACIFMGLQEDKKKIDVKLFHDYIYKENVNIGMKRKYYKILEVISDASSDNF